jgi:rare lipoprotein A
VENGYQVSFAQTRFENEGAELAGPFSGEPTGAHQIAQANHRSIESRTRNLSCRKRQRRPKKVPPKIARSALQQTGQASWYDLDSATASGETMNDAALTAAHRFLPFGTKVLIENIANGRSVVVRINDRGPFVAGRVIDVSKAAAKALDMMADGMTDVRLHVIDDTVASAG